MAGSAYRSASSVEWPTVFLAVTIYGGYFAVTWWWQSLPLIVVIAGGWLVVGMDLFSMRSFTVIPRGMLDQRCHRWVPLSLWLPYPIYKETHFDHHRDEYLTDPIEDPESYYFTTTAWRQLGKTGRRLAQWNTTLLGRLTIGPAIMLLSFLTQEWRLLRDGRRKRRSSWAWHDLGVACVLFWIVVLCEMPLWLYFLSFVYLGPRFHD
nr:fatty acid desaturase [Rhizobium grahamii]